MKNLGVLRKVQLTGGATLIVSLPKEWVKNVKLKPGDYVVIIPQPDNSLKITLAKEDRKTLEATIRISENMSPSAAVREFVARYLLGYNVIKVVFSEGTRYQRDAIRDYMSRSMIGVEIVEESQNSMVVQCLAGFSELPLKTALRRMSNTTYYMVVDVVDSLKESNMENLQDIIKRDDDVDKFYLYIVRQMNLVASGIILPQHVGLKNVRESIGYVMVAKAIERIADHATQIAQTQIKLLNEGVRIDEEIRKAVYDLGSNVLELYVSTIKAIFKQDTITAHDVADKSTEIRKLENEILKLILSTGDDVIRKTLALRIILESFKRIAFYSADISELVISLSIEHST